ncbi:hypothetical protein, partial [Trichloromonas sp.]|uniref:hypothetical protein n=1 Tax=Trichloromonas sp. TaxID=3069249 RepID=UPI003D818FA1
MIILMVNDLNMLWFSSVIFFLVVGLIVVLEYSLRIFYQYYGRSYVWKPYQKIRMEIDQRALQGIPAVCNLVVNSQGEIGSEPPKRKFWRALAVGGSAVECYYLGSHWGWTAELQRKLDQPEALHRLCASAVHVGNISQSGIDSAALAMTLEAILPQYKQLDMVFCMVGGSDVVRWLANGAPDSGESRSRNYQSFFGLRQRRLYRWRISDMAATECVRGICRKCFCKETVKKNVGSRLLKLRKMRMDASAIRDDMGNPEKMLQRYEENLRRVLTMCREKSERVFLILQPWFDREIKTEEEGRFWDGAQGEPYVENVTIYFSFSVLRDCMRLINKSAKNVADSLGIAVIDLQEAVPPGFNNYYDYFHFTKEG